MFLLCHVIMETYRENGRKCQRGGHLCKEAASGRGLCSDSGRTAGLLFLYHSVTTSFPVCPVPPCTQPPAQHPACARQCSYCTRLVHREARGTNFSKWKKNLTSLFAGTWAKFNNCLCNFVIKCKMILSYDMQFIDFSFFFSMLCGYVW